MTPCQPHSASKGHRSGPTPAGGSLPTPPRCPSLHLTHRDTEWIAPDDVQGPQAPWPVMGAAEGGTGDRVQKGRNKRRAPREGAAEPQRATEGQSPLGASQDRQRNDSGRTENRPQGPERQGRHWGPGHPRPPPRGVPASPALPQQTAGAEMWPEGIEVQPREVGSQPRALWVTVSRNGQARPGLGGSQEKPGQPAGRRQEEEGGLRSEAQGCGRIQPSLRLPLCRE